MVAVLGSGGHTAEMRSLLRNINPTKYIHRTYIVSSEDDFSLDRAKDIEATIQSKHKRSTVSKAAEVDPLTGKWDVKVVPRARKIHQPLKTTPLSSLWCLMCCIATLYKTSRTSIAAPFEYPDLIVTNGPATAVMVILASMILKFLGLAPVYKMKTIYVESWARVKTLSKSGEVLLWMGVCDEFYVQWEELVKELNGKTLSRSGQILLWLGIRGKLFALWEKMVRTKNGNEWRKKVKWRGFLVE
jgi:beta-1,4-N-acetylglucosaminyltransferase